MPEALVAQIETESRRRKLSKSDVVRERLTRPEKSRRRNPALLDAQAYALNGLKDYKAALASANAALKQNPKDALGWFNRAVALVPCLSAS